ncbi:MAG: prepilin-type N-terminal cleavage/methylation domain-containing protein [Myxococcales bacterium]|nr:prepilin-type N-terminal cleavage/methylation domain-containing protein [Myxococcales bacterium]
MAFSDRRFDQRGFTLLELMVSIAILGVVLTYVFQTFTTYQRSNAVTTQVTESQQSSRSIAGLLDFDIRHAGFMVPPGGGFCGVDSTTAPDIVYLSDSSAIDPAGLDNNELGAAFNNTGTNVTSGSNVLDVSLSLESPDNFAYDTDGDGTTDSDFRVNAGVIVLDRGDPGRGTACGTVTNVNLGSSQITVNLNDVLGTYSGTGLDLIAIPAHEYRIANGALLRDNMALAMGVEDLQAAYFFDDNGNNLVDAGEYRGDGVGADYDANALNAEDAREIRITFVTRTRNEDAQFPGGRLQTAENRATNTTLDGFRRRVHTSTVQLRNFLIRDSNS